MPLWLVTTTTGMPLALSRATAAAAPGISTSCSGSDKKSTSSFKVPSRSRKMAGFGFVLMRHLLCRTLQASASPKWHFAPASCSLDPLRHTDVELAGASGVPPAHPEQLLAIGAEVGEGVEHTRPGEALQSAPIQVDAEEVEAPSLAFVVVMVGGEDEALAVRREAGREGRPRQPGDLPLGAAIGVHHPDVHLHGLHQVLLEKVLVLGGGSLAFGVVGAPGNEPGIGTEDRAAVVADAIREAEQVLAVQVHPPDVHVAAAFAGEDEPLAVGRGSGLGIVAGRGQEGLRMAAIGVGDVEVIALEHGPLVLAGREGWAFRTFRTGTMGAGEHDLSVTRQEPAAGDPALARTDPLLLGAIGVHGVELVAGVPVPGALENDLLPIVRPVGLGVGTRAGELLHVPEVDFPAVPQIIHGGGLGAQEQRAQDCHKHSFHRSSLSGWNRSWIRMPGIIRAAG